MKNNKLIHDLFCFACRRKVRKSALFDEAFYKGGLNRFSIGLVCPVWHYSLLGRHRGMAVSDKFDVKFCAEKYKIPQSEVFLKYTSHGFNHGWFPKKTEGIELDAETVCYLESQKEKSDAKYAICLHLYHYDLWEEFEASFAEVEDLVDIFITLTDHGDGVQEMSNRITSRFSNAQVLVFPNHGRDIFPFQTLVQAGVFAGYKAIAKFHTKKSRGEENWRGRLVGSIIKDRNRFLEVLDLVENKGAGLVGSEVDMYGGHKFWHSNIEGVRNLCSQLNLPEAMVAEYPEFLGGSIFVVSPSVLESLGSLELTFEDWPIELGQFDGTIGHQIERLFSVICYSQNLKIVGLKA